jgi:hypothetical protein
MFRTAVEDMFMIRNRGLIATGRVESGALRVGDNIGVLFKGIEGASSAAAPSSPRPAGFLPSNRPASSSDQHFTSPRDPTCDTQFAC